MNWAWLQANATQIAGWFGIHAVLAAAPLVIGLAAALPLGWLANRNRIVYPPMITLTGLLYTIPSLALFVLLPGLLGTRILDPINVVAALSVYTIALLVRVVADGLASVPPDVEQAARAMGYGEFGLLVRVELPVAVPVIAAGMRVAAVSNVSLVSVAAVIGVPELGQLFTAGFQLNFYTPIIAGIVLCVVLALIFDATVVGIARWLTPWRRATGGAA
jgi:osmoprotectant transport system permease protein